MKTIGYAIPSYKGHLIYLESLLDAIAESTVLPTEVSVSISSTDEEINFKKYPFKLIITKTSQSKNQSQNRNIAANKLTTDIISFFDCDDLPNKYRNEYLLKAFDKGSDVVVHGIIVENGRNYESIHEKIGDFNLLEKYVDTLIPNCPFPDSSILHIPYSCPNVSLKKEIFDNIKYNENYTLFSENGIRQTGEDSEFLHRIVENNIKICLIKNILSIYIKY
jgi:hypothetical protein